MATPICAFNGNIPLLQSTPLPPNLEILPELDFSVFITNYTNYVFFFSLANLFWNNGHQTEILWKSACYASSKVLVLSFLGKLPVTTVPQKNKGKHQRTCPSSNLDWTTQSSD